MLGDLKYFLGLEIALSSKGINLSQKKYTIQLASWQQSQPNYLWILTSISIYLIVSSCLMLLSLGGLIGRLLYLTIPRPNISYAVNKLSQFMQALGIPHLHALHHVLQYLKQAPGQ